MSQASDRLAPRVLYLQYTNPAAYPPLVHSARLFAEAGWEVLLLGTDIVSALLMPEHRRIRCELHRHVVGGWQQKADYLRFSAWAARWVGRWRPDWVYVSDPLACPAALVAMARARVAVIYHEHDSPPEAAADASVFVRAARAARREVATRADLCVLPSQQRAEMFARAHPAARVVTVWNCPVLDEVASQRHRSSEGLRVLFHGSIVPARLPISVIEALADLPASVTLTVAGYETAGHAGYVDTLQRRAKERGIADRIRFVGTLPRRQDLMELCATCDVGLALMPLESADVNERTMLGASNKPFDYMACGLAVIVSALPGWEETFVGGGFGLACTPHSAASIASALRRLLNHPDERLAMGERGQEKIRTEWHYARMFAPVLDRMQPAAPAPVPGAGATTSHAVRP